MRFLCEEGLCLLHWFRGRPVTICGSTSCTLLGCPPCSPLSVCVSVCVCGRSVCVPGQDHVWLVVFYYRACDISWGGEQCVIHIRLHTHTSHHAFGFKKDALSLFYLRSSCFLVWREVSSSFSLRLWVWWVLADLWKLDFDGGSHLARSNKMRADSQDQIFIESVICSWKGKRRFLIWSLQMWEIFF